MANHKRYTIQDLKQMPPDMLLMPGEIADMMRVDPRTVSRWSKKYPDLLPPTRTPGGHNRFRAADILAVLAKEADPQ